MFVSIKGGAYSRFRMALETGSPLIALTAAQELPELNLSDALALTLVLRADPARYERAAVRWHGRFVREVPGLGQADALLALAALGSIEADLQAGGQALAALCERYGRKDLAEVIDRQL
jgi:hypothetical protein